MRATEFAEHGDLTNYLLKRQQPWTESRACRELSELLRVLDRLHEAGAVHRDLTPQNVLVTAGKILKLGDFGIARHRLGGAAVRADVFNEWLRAVIDALQALRGIALISAVTIVAEVGELSRFTRAPQVMGYSGMGAREDSSGTRSLKRREDDMVTVARPKPSPCCCRLLCCSRPGHRDP